MYSINVFVTFSLTELGMCKFWVTERRSKSSWWKNLPVHAIGLVLCSSILVLQVLEKFSTGGKETALITLGLIGVCFVIRRYYRGVQDRLRKMDPELLSPADAPSSRALPRNPDRLDPAKRTAVLLVGSYNGTGVHALMTIHRLFPGDYEQIVFASVGIVDSANFKGADEVENLEEQTQAALDRYIPVANRLGMAASTRKALGTDAVEESERLCAELAKEFPRSTFFSGKVVFQREKWYHWLLHNQTAYALQRRLEWQGMPMIVLPVRIREA
jgi:hypothetical protein